MSENQKIAGLIDKQAIMQCIGSLMKNPSLLDEYTFYKEDFAEPFYQLLYSLIQNLYVTGIDIIDIFAIDSFCSKYEAQYKIFNQNNGKKYLNDVYEISELENFSYYFGRLKKFSYLRYLESRGFDTRIIYDSTCVEPLAQEKEMSKLDDMTVDDIIDKVESNLVEEPRLMFSANSNHKGQLAGKGIKALKESLKKEPDYGLPLQSTFLTSVCRGAGLKKVFLRSSNSGGGKTRTGVADIAGMSIPYIYDLDKKEFIHTGFSEPSLIISTELEISDIQTLLLAYISGVNETNIIDGNYTKDEEARVDKAAEYIESSPIYIEFIPDFGLSDIEYIIKKYKREKCVHHIFFDYIHMSPKILSEISSESKGMKLREDQVLFLFIDKLKNLANTLDVFILTSTQLNGSYKDSPIKDETMLRGAKSLADRIDLGEISLEPSQQELKEIEPILHKQIGYKVPNLVRNIYKLRRSKYSRIKIWQFKDLGTCRTTDLFITNFNNELIDIKIGKLKSNSKEIDKLVNDNSVAINEEELPDIQEDDSNNHQLIF